MEKKRSNPENGTNSKIVKAVATIFNVYAGNPFPYRLEKSEAKQSFVFEKLLSSNGNKSPINRKLFGIHFPALKIILIMFELV